MDRIVWRNDSSRPPSEQRDLGAPLVVHPGPAPEYDAGGGVDVLALWSAVREQWRFVLGVGAALFALTLAAMLLMHMNFKSMGRLYLGELDNKHKAAAGEVDFVGSGPGDVASEIEIIKSRSLVLEAVARSGLNASIVPAGWSAPRYWKWLLFRRDATLLRGADDAVRVSHASLPNGAREEAKLRVQFVSARDYALYADGAQVAKGTLELPLKTALASFTLHAGAAGAPAQGATYALNIAPLDDTFERVRDALSVLAPKITPSSPELVKVVTLEFVDRSPQKAARFLEELMSAYLLERQAWKVADATAAESFVTNQLSGMRSTLDETQKKLAEYRSNTQMVVLDSEAKALIEQMGKYEEQRVAARLQVAALSDIKRMLRQPNPPVEAYLLGEASDSVLEGLGRSLAEARQHLTDLEGRFHDAAPDVINQKAQISAQLGTIRNYVNSRLDRAQENLGALNGIIGQFEEKLKAVPGAELGLAQLARESDVYSKLYSYLLERQQHAAILKASTVSKNRILDAPAASGRESSPRLLLSLASGIVGLLLGIFVVVFRRFCASTLQSDSDVRVMVRGAPLLASVPHWLNQTTRGVSAADAIVPDAMSPVAEAFRTLRTNLYQGAGPRAGQVLLITSPTPGDGKTTNTLALAAMLAADEKWVLVIDADFRKPSHNRLLGLPEREGLRDILRGRCSWRDVAHPVSGKFGEFFSIGAGTMAPMELLSSERMARFLIEARSRYDYVLIDAASFPLVADPLALAPLADGVLSIVRLNYTPRRLAEEHIRRLSAVAHAHGVVINDAAPLSPYAYGAASAARSQKLLARLRKQRADARR